VRRFERVARAAIARAGALIRARFGGRHAVAFKSATDIVTVTDREAELLIVGALRAAFPDHGIVSEESPPVPARSDYRWYVDPLDGTTNFAHGYPHCAVCIALEHAGEIVLGLVHDPLRRETFSAQRGAGAQLNGRAIGVSDVTELGNALAATGFPSDRRERARDYARFLEVALERVRCVRRSGSAALDLCYVACGRLDVYWEWGLAPWDTAAGRLIVEEAGGRVTGFAGESHSLTGFETAASNGHLHDALVEMLAAGSLRRTLATDDE
jgi:myo-inositol-1(or 4)-monophosphatase